MSGIQGDSGTADFILVLVQNCGLVNTCSGRCATQAMGEQPVLYVKMAAVWESGRVKKRAVGLPSNRLAGRQGEQGVIITQVAVDKQCLFLVFGTRNTHVRAKFCTVCHPQCRILSWLCQLGGCTILYNFSIAFNSARGKNIIYRIASKMKEEWNRKSSVFEINICPTMPEVFSYNRGLGFSGSLFNNELFSMFYYLPIWILIKSRNGLTKK